MLSGHWPSTDILCMVQPYLGRKEHLNKGRLAKHSTQHVVIGQGSVILVALCVVLYVILNALRPEGLCIYKPPTSLQQGSYVITF